MRWLLVATVGLVAGLSLACGGAEPPAAKATASASKLKKPLDAKQKVAAKGVADAKAKNGKLSPDGTKKLQVERKKKKAPNGEVVWVIVEEWVLVDDWHDEIWVVDAFVDDDDLLLVELVDFDEALIDDIIEMEVAELEQAIVEEIVDAVIEEAVEEAIDEAIDEAIEDADLEG